jgi:murein DD-endopeptidase MepM/ murein hydrolase activator NlpD
MSQSLGFMKTQQIFYSGLIFLISVNCGFSQSFDDGPAVKMFSFPMNTDPANVTLVGYVDLDTGSGFTSWNGSPGYPSPGFHGYNTHTGTDFSAAKYTPVIAAASGTIVGKSDGYVDSNTSTSGPNSGDGGSFGNYVVIDHGNNILTLYAHLAKNSLTDKTIDDTVALGEQIGTCGSSGSSSGNHLHFEIRRNGVASHVDHYKDVNNRVASLSGGTLIDPYSTDIDEQWWIDQNGYVGSGVHPKDWRHVIPALSIVPRVAWLASPVLATPNSVYFDWATTAWPNPPSGNTINATHYRIQVKKMGTEGWLESSSSATSEIPVNQGFTSPTEFTWNSSSTSLSGVFAPPIGGQQYEWRMRADFYVNEIWYHSTYSEGEAFTVNSGGGVTFLSVERPNSADVWQAGETALVTWAYGGNVGSTVQFEIQAQGSTIWNPFASNINNDGNASFPLPDPGYTGFHRLKISNSDNSIESTSDYFEIIPALSSAFPEADVFDGTGTYAIVDGHTTPETIDGTDFGSQLVGTSVPHSFLLINNGFATLTASGFDNSSQFRITSVSSSIEPNQTDTFYVYYEPTSTGTHTATITLNTNDPDEGTYTFQVEGSGIVSQPDISLRGGSPGETINDGDTSPTVAKGSDFGSVAVGGTVDRIFRIYNYGESGSNLQIQSVSVIPSTQFQIYSQPTTTNLGSFDQTPFTVRFAPTSSGIKSATVRIISNDPDAESTYEFDVQGLAATIVNDDHGNSIAAATPVGANSSTSGIIEQAGDYDFFRINLGSAATLTVGTTGDTDTYGYLLDAVGNEIDNDDDIEATDTNFLNATERNFQMTHDLGAGTYYVKVRHYSPTGTGSYQFVSSSTSTPVASKAASPTPADRALLVNVNNPALSWTSGGNATRFSISMNTTGSFPPAGSGGWQTGLTQDPQSLGVGSGGTLDPGITYYWRVDSSLDAVTWTTGDVWRFTTAVVPPTITITSPSGGTVVYPGSSIALSWTSTLLTSSEIVSLGMYDGLEWTTIVSSTPNDGNQTILIPSTARIGLSGAKFFVSLNRDSSVFDYSSPITVGDNVDPTIAIAAPSNGSTVSTAAISVAGTATDNVGVASVYVRVNSGTWQTATGTSNWNRTVSLVAGSNLIEAYAQDASGNVSAIVSRSVIFSGQPDDHGNDAGSATAVAHNTPVAGNLEAAGDVDYFRITLSEPSLLLTYSTLSADTFGQLYDSSGSFLDDSDDDGEVRNFRMWNEALPAGVYFVRVTGFNGTATGPYILNIKTLPVSRQKIVSAQVIKESNSFRVGFFKQTGWHYRIERSANGVDWTSFATYYPAAFGAFNAEDTGRLSSSNNMLYRISVSEN